MAIERLIDDGDNKTARNVKKGSLEDRLDALERIVLKLVDPTKLTKKEKQHIDRIKKAEAENPEKDD